jgi:hypothetical protein
MGNLIRRAILALVLAAGLAPAFAQVPAPVPALPDTERRQSYSLTTSTCACAVNFALYGDGTDFTSWIEVFVNGTRVNSTDPSHGWTLTSPSGPFSNLARPITNAVLTFTSPQTGTVQIVGARRPRQTSQFSESRGAPARDLNLRLTDTTATLRELYDKTNDFTGRSLVFAPGVQGVGLLPLPPICSGGFLGFDVDGKTPVCRSSSGTGNVRLPLVDSATICADGTVGNLKQCLGSIVVCSADNTGATDATAALQACITANNQIRIAYGNYKLTSQLTLHSDLRIEMDAGAFLHQDTRGARIFYGSSVANVIISGGILYGEGTFCGNIGQAVTAACPAGEWGGDGGISGHNDRAIQCDACTNLYINRVHTKNNGTNGIAIFGGNGIFINDVFIEGTNLYSTPITSQANHQYGISLADHTTAGAIDNLYINGATVTGVAQGLSFGNYGVSTTGLTRQITSTRAYNIPGQHGFYGGTGNIVITGFSCSNLALDCVKDQISVVNPHNFTATNVSADNIGGNMFNIGTLNAAVGLQNIQLAGVGYNVNRGLSLGGQTFAPLTNVTANIQVQFAVEAVAIQGDSVRDVNIFLDSKSSSQDTVLITATNSKNIHITPIIREPNTANAGRWGILLSSASTDVILHDPFIADASGFMVNGIKNAITGGTIKVLGSANISGASDVCVSAVGAITAWPIWSTLSCTGGSFTGAANISNPDVGSASIPFGSYFMAAAKSVDWGNGGIRIRENGDQMLFELASNGYRFDGTVMPSVNGGTGLGIAGFGWASLNLADGLGQSLRVNPPPSGTPTWAPGSSSGTPAVTASAPLVITAGTGNISCPTCASGSNITVGTTTVTSGTNTALLYNNAGTLGNFVTLPAANFPAHTGDVTNSAGSLALAIGATKVTSAMLNADVFSTAHSWTGQQTGNVTGVGSNAAFLVTGAAPTYAWNMSSNGVDQKNWDITQGAPALLFRAVNDANSAATTWMTVTRGSGTAISSVNIAGLTATNATFITPALGTPASGVATNLTGTAAGLTAGNVTTNANSTGAITSVGNATSLGSFTSANLSAALTNETGTGVAVFGTSPQITTPDIVGVTDASNASAGSLGEFQSVVVELASPVALTNNTLANVTSKSLTAGDWHVCGNFGLTGAATTTVTYAYAGLNSTSATLPTSATDQTNKNYAGVAIFGGVGNSSVSSVPPCRRFNISATTTIYLVAQVGFAVSTTSAYGKIEARRWR